jgi:adenylosuccinate synthase
MIEYVDIVAGLAWGDEGKGKVISQLSRNPYDIIARWAGGSNAGHTVYLNSKKYKTHIIPSGIFRGKLSYIGPGCVLNVKSFLKEVDYLKENGFDTSLIKVSPRTFIVEEKHIAEDAKKLSVKLGTTSSGIAPAYSEKAARSGRRASQEPLLAPFVQDIKLFGKILCEGAQGFWLDLDWGNYPYVTSSTTLPYGACSLGFSPHKIRNIWGVAKIYDTRSGVDPIFPHSLNEDLLLSKVQSVGAEYGTTTGRKRKVNWLNVNKLIEAVNISGTTHLVINKCDILESVNEFRFTYKGKLHLYSSFEPMKETLLELVCINTAIKEESIYFSFDPEKI